MRLLPLFVSLATASAGLAIAVVPRQVVTDPYTATFTGLSGATEASDYLTFKLVSSLNDCLNFCTSVAGCTFANIYHDVNGKNGSPLFTCSLYRQCHDSSTAINTGGQSQPNGSINYITDSAGWCDRT